MVVSTYRRPHLLPRLVGALEAQTVGPERFEVIIVDNASPDETSAVLEELAATTPLDLRVDRAAVNRGPAGGRNLGVSHATAPYVAFTDDDCVPSRGWLEALLEHADGTSKVVVGRTVPDPSATPRPFDRILRVDDTRFMQTCNVLYRREDLDRLGGFDTRIRFGEDTDLGLRALEAGARPEFADAAEVAHDVRARSWRGALRDTGAWVDLPLIVRRHPSIRRTHLHRRFFWKASHPPAIVAAAGLAMSRRHPVLGAASTIAWLRYRTVHAPLPGRRRQRLAALPGALVVDLAEVVTMVRGSVRHRTVVL